MKEYVYLATYNPCIYEAGDIPFSAHKTRAGAEKDVEKHKAKILKKRPQNVWERWDVEKLELKP